MSEFISECAIVFEILGIECTECDYHDECERYFG